MGGDVKGNVRGKMQGNVGIEMEGDVKGNVSGLVLFHSVDFFKKY